MSSGSECGLQGVWVRTWIFFTLTLWVLAIMKIWGIFGTNDWPLCDNGLHHLRNKGFDNIGGNMCRFLWQKVYGGLAVRAKENGEKILCDSENLLENLLASGHFHPSKSNWLACFVPHWRIATFRLPRQHCIIDVSHTVLTLWVISLKTDLPVSSEARSAHLVFMLLICCCCRRYCCR